VLVNHESSIGAFILTVLYLIYLALLPFAYHIIPALIEYQP
jgi:hypothetical protein